MKQMNIVRPIFPALETFDWEFKVALANGNVTNHGLAVEAFEEKLTKFLGVPTIVFNNGQTALMAMLAAVIGFDGGEVIMPSFTFPGTAAAVRWCGATPVFADIKDDGTFTVDPANIARCLSDQTAAILAVDAYGISCDYMALAELGKRHGVPILYDSAPAFGTLWNGRSIGEFGQAQIFSFHATKAFSTMEGGCLSSRDGDLLDAARDIRNFGLKGHMPGLNGKMMEVCALVGLEQLKRFHNVRERRGWAASLLQAGLDFLPGLRVGKAKPGCQPIWLYMPLTVDASQFGMDRDQLADKLAERGIMVRRYYSPACHQMPAYESTLPLFLPVTERVAASVLALPVYSDMTLEECDRITRAVREIYKEGK